MFFVYFIIIGLKLNAIKNSKSRKTIVQQEFGKGVNSKYKESNWLSGVGSYSDLNYLIHIIKGKKKTSSSKNN